MKYCLLLVIILIGNYINPAIAQQQDSLINLNKLRERLRTLEQAELVQSMSQRSLLTPSYFAELKALIARQAYNFWIENEGEKYVSHLNVYAALYYGNKYLKYDSINRISYNQILGHNESVVSIKFGHDPYTFYSAGSDGRLLKWDLRYLNAPPTILHEGKHLIRSIDVSHNDEYILVVTKDQGVILVNTTTSAGSGIESDQSAIRDTEPVQAAVFLPNELKYIAINKKGELRVKGYQTDSTSTHRAKGKVLTMAVNPDDSKLYAGTEEGKVEIWGDTSESLLYIKDPYAVNAIAISPDHQFLAIGREKGDAIIWDMNKKEVVRTISGHQSAVTDVDFNADNSLLLTASRDKTARIWDIHDSKKLPIVLDDHENWVRSAAFDPSGKLVITGSADNFLRIWPVDHAELANRICELVSRNLTKKEWNEYVGKTIPYQKTCP